VVDLPDLVGHPAFPTTMETLVARNGGTVLDAALAALERGEADGFVVPGPRLLAPVLPASFRSRDAADAVRPVVGPDDEIAWPAGAGWLDYQPKVAAVLRRPTHLVPREAVGEAIFGFTLVNDLAARAADGDPTPRPDAVPLALGPCIVTGDEVDPQTVSITVRVDGEQWAKGNLNGTAADLLGAVAAASRLESLGAGDAFASSPFDLPGFEQRIWPGAEIELEAEGIGILRNRIARPT
jgi:2-keto-4-pentenoate hydratase/2-oxohepta-3-ene-1,7-dioic acid hydratase in catechol pathway